MNTKTNSHHKNRHPTIAFLNKFLVLYVLVLVALLFSCATTTPNIKSADDLNEKKLLIGRFMFYINEELVESYEIEKSASPVARRKKTKANEEDKRFLTGFEVFFKKGKGKTRKLELDEKGYAYLPVKEGQYCITRIKHHNIFGTYSFRLHMKPDININTSDRVVSFGTIKVEFKQDVDSKAVGVLTGIATGILTQGLWPATLAPGGLDITQTSDWDTPRQYVASKFNISPELIRDEIVKFPEK